MTSAEREVIESAMNLVNSVDTPDNSYATPCFKDCLKALLTAIMKLYCQRFCVTADPGEHFVWTEKAEKTFRGIAIPFLIQDGKRVREYAMQFESIPFPPNTTPVMLINDGFAREGLDAKSDQAVR